MAKEYETQVVDIDRAALEAKLRELGATEEPEVFQKRWTFDMAPDKNGSVGEWIRLRQVEGQRPTITYKNKMGQGIDEMNELEAEVDDFDTAYAILSKLPFGGVYYQENRRKKFVYSGIEFTIDTWPMIPPYLEIEAKSTEDVLRGLELLGLDKKENGHYGTMSIYRMHGIDLHAIADLRF